MGNSNNNIDELIEMGDRLDDQGETAQALECWRRIVQIERDASLLCRFGRLAMKVGHWEEALQSFLDAVESDPNLQCAYQYLAMWHQEQGALESALFYFTKALAIEGNAPAYTLLGSAQLRLCMVQEAQENFTRALEIDPGYEEAWYNLGLTYAENEPQRAIELFQKAIDLDPEYVIAHVELGWVLRGQLEYSQAEYHLRRAVQLDNLNGWAHVYLGNTLWAQRDFSGAEKSFKRGIEVWPDSSTPVWALALFYEFEGRLDDARELYLQALQIDPDDPVANNSFGEYLRAIGDVETAKVYIKRALVLDPTDTAIESVLSGLESGGHSE